MRYAKPLPTPHNDLALAYAHPEELSFNQDGKDFAITSEKIVSREQEQNDQFRPYFDEYGRIPAYLECAVRGHVLHCAVKTRGNQKIIEGHNGFEINSVNGHDTVN